MRFAGHLPTKHFAQAEWLAMKAHPEHDHGTLPEGGTYRSTLGGKPIVFHTNWETKTWWAVRPIVRVAMGRADV